MYMDTDSMYMAISSDSFEEIIKPDMKNDYLEHKCEWFPRNDTKENAKFDKRTPGLFKVEFEGDGMVALAPKLYYVLGSQGKDKFSSKGVQKSNEILNYKIFKDVLETNGIMYVDNKGMRYVDNQVVWYTTHKKGLTAKYNKRKVLEDKITTVPLEVGEYV